MLAAMSRPLRLDPQAVEWRAVEGEVVALDLNRASYLGINPTGAILWEEIARGTTRDVLVERLMEGFEIDRPRAESDVDAFIEDLAGRGLLASPE